jgi:hypothetical protein
VQCSCTVHGQLHRSVLLVKHAASMHVFGIRHCPVRPAHAQVSCCLAPDMIPRISCHHQLPHYLCPIVHLVHCLAVAAGCAALADGHLAGVVPFLQAAHVQQHSLCHIVMTAAIIAIASAPRSCGLHAHVLNAAFRKHGLQRVAGNMTLGVLLLLSDVLLTRLLGS